MKWMTEKLAEKDCLKEGYCQIATSTLNYQKFGKLIQVTKVWTCTKCWRVIRKVVNNSPTEE